ncbi:MAG: urea carboxylase-associated family protein [Devosia sp.]|uniref:urea carboxylase-associated family protein n=1 Tax=Devosia sp. TaxID=1871048 RepID=UPI0024CB3CEA|nr:urea carboxylase-associated family protein [Devosia sp.]UYO00202.1 MAG: urea carboxylase-associated family protein [Devosia sp.]
MSELLCRYAAHHPDGTNNSAHQVLGDAGRIEQGVLHVVPAREGRAIRVRRGERLKVINTHGSQVGDFWAFSEADPGEHLSMEHLRPDLRRLTPGPGDAMVTNRRRNILTLLEDTSPGVHDTLVASCDIHRYHKLGHAGYHDNCTDNLRMALAAVGIALPEVPCPLNLWMNTPPQENGDMLWLPPVSRPSDFVTFRAEMDLIAVISACPMDLLPINGADSTPRSLSVTVLA